MLLFAFLGLWPTLAVGAGALAIPVIIHLINRRRFKIVPWAAMRFLLAAQKQTRKRMRIEQMLLLLVRMAILGLVIFAMACVMPWAEELWQKMGLAQIGRGNGGRAYRIHHLIVLDASLSMNQKVGGEPAFEIARRKILEKIQDNPSGDGYSVLLLKEHPTWLVGEASQDARKVSREIEQVKPSHGNASLPIALGMISAKLHETRSRFPMQAVYFFTDMQRSTLAAAAMSDVKTEGQNQEKKVYQEIKELASTYFVDVGPSQKDNGNLAIANLEFDYDNRSYVTTKSDVALKAGVVNYSDEAKPGVRAELYVAKARESDRDTPWEWRFKGQEIKDVPARGQQTFTFRDTKLKFDTPGTYGVKVTIPGDALEQDDSRAMIITVRETIPVLLVNGKPSAEPVKRATGYLRMALNPFPLGAEPPERPLRPRVVSPEEFLQISDADMKTYDCIFWCDVGQFGANHVHRLEQHLHQGGGLIVTMGDLAADHLDTYNRLLYKDDQGLLPARLLRKVVSSPSYNFFLQGSDYALPPLTAFADERDRLTLATARFRDFVEAEVTEGKGRTVLTFNQEIIKNDKFKADPTLPVQAPALVEWNPPLSRAHQPADVKATNFKKGLARGRRERALARYRGKVMLLTTAVNGDWSNWFGSPSFGVLMHEMTRLAVAGRLREQALNVGSLLEGYLPSTAEGHVTVYYPDKALEPARVETQVLDDINFFRFSDTDVSGIYKAVTDKGDEIPFAVNTPAASSDQREVESDLRRIDERGLQDLYPEWNFKVLGDAREVTVANGPGDSDTAMVLQPVGPFYANVALLLVLSFLFLEIVLAWHFGHYTTVDPTRQAGVSNFTSTTIAAVIAVIAGFFCTIGAAILIHEHFTGDFLGFFPDLLRTWVERSLGKEALQPGESMNWDYVRQSFLFGLPAENWWAIAISLGALAAIYFTYKAEAPNAPFVYKLLLGALRFCLILMTVWFLLPRPELHFARRGFPDIVLLIDDTRSMGEQDVYQDAKTQEQAKKLSDLIREKLSQELPTKIAAIKADLDTKSAGLERDPDLKGEVDSLTQRLEYWRKQQDMIAGGHWRPSRLQLVQAILARPEPHWLKDLLVKNKKKVHVFHLDATGKATKLNDLKGDAGELVDPTDTEAISRALAALAQLEPKGEESRLGTAVRQVIDHYRGSSLTAVIMFTDGVTTRDETIEQVGKYAAQRAIPLFFIGLGDPQPLRELKLSDLSYPDTIDLGDTVNFDCRLKGEGYKDLTVAVVLKLREKDGRETVLKRQLAKVDPKGAAVKIKFQDIPKTVGRKRYVIEVEPPKVEGNEKPIPPANLRLEPIVEVVDAKQIKVLYVEGQPRYEFRYLKFLLEREALNEKKTKSIYLKTLLLDADEDFAKTDKTALTVFPPTLDDPKNNDGEHGLSWYDVIIFGDCDPNHKKLGNENLKNIVRFVQGVDAKGKKAGKTGGGILFIAGALNNPHRYKNTPLADIMPIVPEQDIPPPDVPRTTEWRPELTPAGLGHPIFKFSQDEGENISIWQRLQKIYWYSTAYRHKPQAEILMVHNDPKVTALFKDPNHPDGRHPLVVHQIVGSGRSMFFGIDETWRWRRDGNEPKYNNFWIQTIRFLARGRSTRTELRLDKQEPYKVGEKMKVMVIFPDSSGGQSKGPKLTDKTEVKVTVEYTPPDAKKNKGEQKETNASTIQLEKTQGSWGHYDGTFAQTREGKYRFRLIAPDVSATQPDGEKPSAEAIVILPPGELDKLRMNAPEMRQAAGDTQGDFFTLKNADEVLDKLPTGGEPILADLQRGQVLWNQWWSFALMAFLITSEWILRKMKHLL